MQFATNNQNDLTINRAVGIIQRAEFDLGHLSEGQRRDLLKDNTDWTDGTIKWVVRELAKSL